MRKATNKYEQKIDGELDLHGYTSEEAKSLVREFIEHAEDENFSRIRIIVGKGTRSPNGSVLGPTIKNWLEENRYNYTYAKIQDGGEGALVVTI